MQSLTIPLNVGIGKRNFYGHHKKRELKKSESMECRKRWSNVSDQVVNRKIESADSAPWITLPWIHYGMHANSG